MFAYFDNSSTTQPAQEVIETVNRLLTKTWGNPSSLHEIGILAEEEMTKSREILARAFGGSRDEIIFTSGGTESDNLAIRGSLLAKRQKHIITTSVEHPAVLNVYQQMEQEGYRVTYLEVDENCEIDYNQLSDAVGTDTALVSIMAVNNETGHIFDIGRAGHIIKEKNPETYFFVDGVQGFSKVRQELSNVDMYSVSGHKIHGMKGIGCLYKKKSVRILPIVYGGGQEKNIRSGTENMPGIAALGAAAEISLSGLDENFEAMQIKKENFLANLQRNIPDIVVNGTNTCPYILNVSFLGVKSEVLLHTLEGYGIYVSSGSACSSKKGGQSHVFKAMKKSPAETDSAIRFSFSRYNTVEQLDYCAEILADQLPKLRRVMGKR